MVKSRLTNNLICSNWIVREKPLTFYIVKYLYLGFKSASLEGIQAGFIAMLIQWKSVLTKRQTVSLSTNFLNQFGISRGVKLRSLKLLEKAGLMQ